MLSESRCQTVLSDPANPSFNGREYCSRPDRHLYQLFLQLEEIEQRTTQVRRPQIRRIRPCNGFVERFQRTLLDEHFRIQGRKKFYETLNRDADPKNPTLGLGGLPGPLPYATGSPRPQHEGQNSRSGLPGRPAQRCQRREQEGRLTVLPCQGELSGDYRNCTYCQLLRVIPLRRAQLRSDPSVMMRLTSPLSPHLRLFMSAGINDQRGAVGLVELLMV